MLSNTNKTIMLSFIMLNVIMLSVVTPSLEPNQAVLLSEPYKRC
jgi:hypothetical protein